MAVFNVCTGLFDPILSLPVVQLDIKGSHSFMVNNFVAWHMVKSSATGRII